MKAKLHIAASMLLFSVLKINASEQPSAQVESIQFRTNGIVVLITKSSSGRTSVPGCVTSSASWTTWTFRNTLPMYKEFVSLLLGAKSTGSSIRIVGDGEPNGCRDIGGIESIENLTML